MPSRTSEGVAPSRRTSSGRRALPLSAVVVAGALLLAACGGSGDDGTTTGASATPSATTEPTASPSSTATADPSADPTATGPGAGCAPNDATVPAGATTVQTIDVDGDGRPDTAWISGGADRAFGITTASGATFSVPIASASPLPASAVVNAVGADGTPVALVDVGRAAYLYTLTDCAVTPTQNAQGEPYTFDRGFGDQGTGVGCTVVDGVLQVAGLDATQSGDTWTVSRTFVELSDHGRHATNGTPEVVATKASASDEVVTTAREVSCGQQAAGDGGLVEPQG